MNAPVSGQDRQRHVRTATLLPGRLVADETTYSCEMLNLSIGGARLRVESLPERLDRVTVQIDGYPDMSGYVVWRTGSEVGVEFDYESRTGAQRLQAEMKPQQLSLDQRKTVRVSVLWSGRILADDGGDDLPCMVLNISAEGARMRLSIPAAGRDFDQVRLHVDRLGQLSGQVAWREADEMAISFDEDPDNIAELLRRVLPRAQFAAISGEE